jgi:ComF family protein
MGKTWSAVSSRPLRGALDALLSVLFPAPCHVCHQPLTTASRIPVCAVCLSSLRRIDGAVCRLCGRPFPPAVAAAPGNALCHACVRRTYRFDLARSYGRYDPAMERILILLKYQPIVPLGAWLADRIEQVVHGEPAIAKVDWLVPVPLDRSRRRSRGYNQVELIARPLARRLGLPLRLDLLQRLRPRPNKLKLSRRERWETVRGAFVASPGRRVDRARILLVDDVLTSGATLDACARALRSSGAEAIHAVTVGRVMPFAEPAPPPHSPQSP